MSPTVRHAIMYLILGGGGLLVGVVFRWWGLLVPIGLACFLAYAWEFTLEGTAFAVLVAVLGTIGVALGAVLRRIATR